MTDPVEERLDVDRIQLCGRLAATIGGQTIEDKLTDREERWLFAYLVVHRLQPVDHDVLIDSLWPTERPDDAEARIDRLLKRLRRVVGSRLETRLDVQLRLTVGAIVDIESAAEAVHRAEAAVARSDWTSAWPAARVALHIARRTFLPGGRAPWIVAQRERLRQIELRSLECVAATGLGLGGNELGSAERAGRGLIEREPFRESGYRYLIQALARQGNLAQAQQVYKDLVLRLQRDLGIAPGPETRALHEQITRTGAVTPGAADANPIMRTFLFTDICDSTPLVSTIGDPAWRYLMEWHDRVVGDLIQEYRGEVLDQAGDGFFAAFEVPADAIACAVAIQRRLASHRVEHGFAPFVRIGAHTDRAVPARGKYAGRGVHLAARVAATAGPNEIVVTASTAETTGVALHQQRAVSLKGLADPVEIGLLQWQR
jgi:SARP family transcriptional regulator, regulator of embCAB operon